MLCTKYKNRDEILNKVDEWHNSNTNNSLEEFIGINKEEFLAYVTGNIVFEGD